jgi:chromosome segregation ATPase
MAAKEQENALNPEEELKKLRRKTDRDELGELHRGLMGGYRSRDVAMFVERLKDQMQTAEKTFKSRISELTQEREKLKSECGELSARLKKAETAAKETKAAKQDEAVAVADRAPGEADPELQVRVEALQAELQQALEQKETLAAERDDMHAALEVANAKLETEAGTLSRQLEEAARENKALKEQAEALTRANAGLSAQLETSKRNILESVNEKDAFAQVNEQLREAMNCLLVKAEAALQENEALNARLNEEREQTQRYRALFDTMGDMLARVRTAGRMLDDRVDEMGKALSWGNGQASRPATGAHRKTKAELLDFTDGKGSAVKELMGELKSIQGGAR